MFIISYNFPWHKTGVMKMIFHCHLQGILCQMGQTLKKGKWDPYQYFGLRWKEKNKKIFWQQNVMALKFNLGLLY